MSAHGMRTRRLLRSPLLWIAISVGSSAALAVLLKRPPATRQPEEVTVKGTGPGFLDSMQAENDAAIAAMTGLGPPPVPSAPASRP